VAAQEAERSRIGRELHDDLGQQIALLGAKLGGLIADYNERRGAVRAGLQEARIRVDELAKNVHNLSHELHPAKLRILGLVQTLEILCRDLAAESGLSINFDADGMRGDVVEDIAVCLFRVTQESLQNALKHSSANVIDVHLSSSPSHITLRVTDDGKGFAPLASQWAGLGLLTMRERVELQGGLLRVETGSTRGTMIEATVPLTTTPARSRRAPGQTAPTGHRPAG
jgi:signal transduction histidine kinase